MERLPQSPEIKDNKRFVPFEEVYDTTGGRFYIGIKTPPFVPGRLGVRIDRLTRYCNFANVGQASFVPSKGRGLDQHIAPPTNSDGSTTQVIAQSVSPKGDHRIHPRNNSAWEGTPVHYTAAIKDVIVEIPTAQISGDLVQSGSEQDTSIRAIQPWAKSYDVELRRQLKEVVRACMLTDHQDASLSLGFLSYAPILGILLQKALGGVVNEFGLVLSLQTLITMPLFFNGSLFKTAQQDNAVFGEGTARAQFSFFPLDQYDRYLVLKCLLSRPGLVGVVRE